MGLEATKQIVFECVVHLRRKEGKKKPSWRWFTIWLKASHIFHTLKTKPIERTRQESHSEDEVGDWFKGYQAAIKTYNITKGKNLLNMDESGVRVGCLTEKEVIVPVEITDLYAPSPENRKSVTVFKTIHADGQTPPPLLWYVLVLKSWIPGFMID